jgi:hypothetical protein
MTDNNESYRQMIFSPEVFANAFSEGLKEQLSHSFGDTGHLEDLVAHASIYAENVYQFVSALSALNSAHHKDDNKHGKHEEENYIYEVEQEPEDA